MIGDDRIKIKFSFCQQDGVKDAFDVAVQIAMKKIETAATVDDEEEKEQTSCWKDLLCMCCVS